MFFNIRHLYFEFFSSDRASENYLFKMRSTSNATTCQAVGLSISLVLLMMLATLAQSRPYHSVKIATFRSHTNPFGTEPSLVSRISIAESLRGGATVEEEDDDVDQYDDYDVSWT